jgi:hypothetical protein
VAVAVAQVLVVAVALEVLEMALRLQLPPERPIRLPLGLVVQRKLQQVRRAMLVGTQHLAPLRLTAAVVVAAERLVQLRAQMVARAVAAADQVSAERLERATVQALRPRKELMVVLLPLQVHTLPVAAVVQPMQERQGQRLFAE